MDPTAAADTRNSPSNDQPAVALSPEQLPLTLEGVVTQLKELQLEIQALKEEITTLKQENAKLKKEEKDSSFYNVDSDDDEDGAYDVYRDSNVYTSSNLHSPEVKKKREIGNRFMFKFSDINVLKKIGKGNFATAHEICFENDNKKHYVLKKPTKKAKLDDFKIEMMGLMNAQGQENILKFIGIVSSPGGQECFVTEFCALGSLDKLHHTIDLTQPEHFWRIAAGLLAGIEHLHHNNYIHRDIACRNVLMTDTLEVRISDFGLAVHAPTGEHKSKLEEQLPWPWMHPKTLATRDRVFTPKSDLWALGVTLWELLTKGAKPYGLERKLIPGIIKGTVTLEIPKMWDGTPIGHYVSAYIGRREGDGVDDDSDDSVDDDSHDGDDDDSHHHDSHYGVDDDAIKTPLIWAMKNGKTNTTKLLIEKGINLEANGEEGKTPLILASKWGQVDTAKLLIEKGANLGANDEEGKTPLIWASECGQVYTAKLLIEKGANLGANDEVGKTPLIWASKCGQVDTAKLLIEKGANIEAKDDGDKSSLHWVSSVDIAKLLIENKANLEAKDTSGKTPLICACDGGKIEIAKLFIERGAKTDDLTLHLACRGGLTEFAKLLIEKGEDLESMDVNGNTPLLRAAEDGLTEVANLLIEKGANLEAKEDEFGSTPLDTAIYHGHTDIAKLLIEKRVNLEVKDIMGHTCLAMAINNGHTEVAKLLVEKKANLETRDNDDQTPLFAACTSFRDATDMVQLLIDKNANLEAKDKRGTTPLIHASWRGHTDTAKLLIENGADLFVKCNNGKTALDWAQELGKEDVVKLLELHMNKMES